jgi:ABC-type bacteriocin/lantibiotic exporter with double-glycine peptidase domain
MYQKALLPVVLAVFLSLGVAAAETSGVWLDVPYVHQEKDGCGSASLAMLLQYWIGKHASVPAGRSDPAQIQRQLYSPDAHGIHASAMETYLRASGFEVFAFRGDWKDLREHLAKGRPLIVSLKPGSGAALHYAVVVGIDWANGAVFLNDPARSKLLRVERDQFAKEWRGAGFWTLLAVPKRPS